MNDTATPDPATPDNSPSVLSLAPRDEGGYTLVPSRQPLSVRSFLNSLLGGASSGGDQPAGRPASLADTLGRLIANLPHKAVRLEFGPLCVGNLQARFAGVVLPDDRLARPADASAFAEHFRQPHERRSLDPPDDAVFEGLHESIAVFPNLSGDATLVVPRPLGPGSSYTHLAEFVRTAPIGQQRAFWHRLATELLQNRTTPRDRLLWVSTAGGGVPWLHLRIDTRPKYIRHAPFRQPPVWWKG